MWRTPRIKFFFQKIFYLSLLPALFIKIEMWKQYDLLCPYSGFPKYLCFLLICIIFTKKKIIIMPQMNHPNAFSLLSFFFFAVFDLWSPQLCRGCKPNFHHRYFPWWKIYQVWNSSDLLFQSFSISSSWFA